MVEPSWGRTVLPVVGASYMIWQKQLQVIEELFLPPFPGLIDVFCTFKYVSPSVKQERVVHSVTILLLEAPFGRWCTHWRSLRQGNSGSMESGSLQNHRQVVRATNRMLDIHYGEKQIRNVSKSKV